MEIINKSSSWNISPERTSVHMIQKIFIRWCCHLQETLGQNCMGCDHNVDIRSVDLLKMAKEAGKKKA